MPQINCCISRQKKKKIKQKIILNLLWPPLESGYYKQGNHCIDDVIKVEIVPCPFSRHSKRFGRISIFISDEFSPAFGFCGFGLVVTLEEGPLEELNSDNGEHKLQHKGDQHDVSDSFDGHNHTLDDVLETFGSVDGPEGTQHTQNTKNLDHGDGI